MAFENIFRGIDFQAPARAQQADISRLQQAIGSGIAQYQAGQDRELRDRQLGIENAARQAKAQQLDLGQATSEALYRQNLGQPLTPQDEAAILAQSQLKGAAPYQDPITGQMRFPETLAQRAGLGGASAPVGRAVPAPSQGLAPDQPLPRGINLIDGAPVAQLNQQQLEAQLGGIEPAGQQLGAPQITGQLAGTPRASLLEAQAQLDIQKEDIKSRIGESKERRKFALEKERGIPKAEKRMLDNASTFSNTAKNIDEAIGDVNNWTAGVGSWLSVIPATAAKDLQANLKQIQADAAFGALQNMRDNSKTGGALGQVSERELALLQSSVAALDQDQSPAQLKENLEVYSLQRENALNRTIDAYEEDYGYVPEGIKDLIGNGNKRQTPKPSRDQILQELRRRRGQ